jgi:methionine synthase II (cobalamin-independent)
MLAGPVTILAWSFVCDDQPLAETARQVVLALRDEIVDADVTSTEAEPSKMEVVSDIAKSGRSRGGPGVDDIIRRACRVWPR